MMPRTPLLLFAFAALIAVSAGLALKKAVSVAGVDDQCKDRGFFGACFDFVPELDWAINPEMCSKLKCAQWQDERPHLVAVETAAALDGTECGDSKMCRAGSCVTVDKKEIPQRKGSRQKWYCSTLNPNVVTV